MPMRAHHSREVFALVAVVVLLSAACGRRNDAHVNDVSDTEVREAVRAHYNRFSAFRDIEKAYRDLIDIRFSMQTNTALKETYFSTKYYFIMDWVLLDALTGYTNRYFAQCLGIAAGLNQYGNYVLQHQITEFLNVMFYHDMRRYLLSVVRRDGVTNYFREPFNEAMLRSLSKIEIVPIEFIRKGRGAYKDEVLVKSNELYEIDQQTRDPDVHALIQAIHMNNRGNYLYSKK
ncbi:MAG: hypothetical protein HZC28_05070 [Spirochaetes bacterium]|nr:hypothetical protein [Spirochaetota bacterium]